MAWLPVTLPTKFYKSEDESALPDMVGARLIDGYVDELGIIHKRPGLEVLCDLGSSSEIQGLYWWDALGKTIAVSNGQVYTIDDISGAFTNVTGDALVTSGKVSFATDGTTLVMANGGRMVTYASGGSTTYMADADAPTTVSYVVWLDGYMLAVDTSNLGRVYYSSPTDITSWGATDFFTAETDPDALQFIGKKDRVIYLFGKETTEAWWDDGATPFKRIDGMFVETGTLAKDSVAIVRKIWTFFDDQRRISTIEGNNINSVSSAFDDEIRGLRSVSDAIAMSIDLGVRSWYVLTFKTANKTYVWDLTTSAMYEWGIYDSSDGTYDRFRGTVHTYARSWQFNLIGDKSNGKIYKLSTSKYQDDTDEIRTLIRTGHMSHGTNRNKRSNAVRLRVKRGAGLNNATVAPKMSMRWRDNNGAWSNWHQRSLGLIGEQEFFITFRNMGTYRTRQYEIMHSDNSDFILINMEEDIEVLSN